MNSMIFLPYTPVQFAGSRPSRPRPATALDAVLRVLDIWRQRIADRDHLAEMDEKNLVDTGISPAAARAEAAKPFWRA
ncbi:MAG: hypothetical protein ACPGVX_07110 [Thalassobaculaceae bacterium]